MKQIYGLLRYKRDFSWARESYSTKSATNSILDLPTTFDAFNWKIFNLNLGDMDYNDLLIRFYSKLGKDPEQVWKISFIFGLKGFKELEKFEGRIQNYRFVLCRGSKRESHKINVADLPLVNPYNVFSIYRLSSAIKGPFPNEFQGFLKNFLTYIQTVVERDIELIECLKRQADPPKLKIDPKDLADITNKKDRLILENLLGEFSFMRIIRKLDQ